MNTFLDLGLVEVKKCVDSKFRSRERLAGATAIGPLIQGLRRPFTDVSRGCSVDDIVDCAAVAAITEWAD